MSYGIGVVQTAQRLGPALGPVIGGAVAQLVGLRRAFLVTAVFYVFALALVFVMYREPRAQSAAGEAAAGRVTFRSVLAFENFILLVIVIFGLQFVDRSFGPVLPLFVGELGTSSTQVPLLSGILFSLVAGAGAIGNHLCAKLLGHLPARRVIAITCAAAGCGVAAYLLAGNPWWLILPTAIFGVAMGASTTAAYTAASGVIPAAARGAGFGLLTTASLVGLAVSPIVNGVLAATSIRAVFAVDAAILGILALTVSRLMLTSQGTPATTAPPGEEI
jgi:MFS transporter, DHA1 family, multidrug resistance protein